MGLLLGKPMMDLRPGPTLNDRAAKPEKGLGLQLFAKTTRELKNSLLQGGGFSRLFLLSPPMCLEKTVLVLQ